MHAHTFILFLYELFVVKCVLHSLNLHQYKQPSFGGSDGNFDIRKNKSVYCNLNV